MKRKLFGIILFLCIFYFALFSALNPNTKGLSNILFMVMFCALFSLNYNKKFGAAIDKIKLKLSSAKYRQTTKRKDIEIMVTENVNKLKNLTPKGILLIIAILLLVLCNPIAIVGVGERGVKVTLGMVSPESYGEGIHFVVPFIQKMHNMDVKTQKDTVKTQVYTKDIQQAGINYVINYNLKQDSAHKMYQEVGMDYVNKIIVPTSEGTIKDVIGKWNAQDLVANREKATREIKDKLILQLSDNYITLTDFNIIDINYSDVFEKAIEAKVTAEQEALKAKNKTVQIEEEAKQKLISAQAEAKSMSIRANALTQNKALVEYEAVKKWDGKLPNYMMGNSVPFINLTTKK